MIFWGWLGDRFNPRNVVVLGMAGSAVTVGSLCERELVQLGTACMHLTACPLRLGSPLGGVLLHSLLPRDVGCLRSLPSLWLSE